MSTPAPPLVEPPLLEAGPLWRQVDFIADLHLQTATPATFASWLHYLETTPADAVFMLGDLFEAWVGDDVTQDPGEDGAFATRCADPAETSPSCISWSPSKAYTFFAKKGA